jgi:2-phospho-L-lactate guanylyltransferase
VTDRCWIVVPARSFDRGKTRLAPVLDAAGRRRFSRNSFTHVVRSARKVCRNVVVVSSSGEVLGLARRLGASGLKERESGLVASAHQGTRFALAHSARIVVVVHADLPELSSSELRRLVHALSRQPGIALAPDRDRDGTNALGLRSSRPFTYRFGSASFNRHLAESRRRRVRSRILQLPGISRDIDSPVQYRAFMGRNNKL